MKRLKPKEQHERHLATIDKEQIEQHLTDGSKLEITRIAVSLARECTLFVHFQRLWEMRVSELDEGLRTERYMQNIYVNKRALYKELSKTPPPAEPKPAESEPAESK